MTDTTNQFFPRSQHGAPAVILMTVFQVDITNQQEKAWAAQFALGP